MKKVVLVLALIFQFCFVKSQITTDFNFNLDWKFQKGEIQGAEKCSFDDSGWRILDLPHDWGIEDLPTTNDLEDRIISGPFDSEAVGGKRSGYTVGGIAWYRKHFKIPQTDSGKVVYINFDGIYMNSTIWVNGTKVFHQPYGYTPFWINLTEYLKFGETGNTIAVRVENTGVSSRWYTGSGINRYVTLRVVDKIHFKPWGIFVTTPQVNQSLAEVAVSAELNNTLSKEQDVDFKIEIYNPSNELVATKIASTRLQQISHKTMLKVKIDNPKLWSPQYPNLYTLKSQVIQDGKIVDSRSTNFGIRKIEYDSEKGMFLNGEKIVLKGGCVHANNGCLGTAAYEEAEKRRVRILKECGYNAVRCAHNTPSKVFLDECDKQGLLVIDEAFDVWKTAKTPDDYHQYFDDYWKFDLGNMILRDRNHPGIFTWSTGNQIRTAKTSLTISNSQEITDYAKTLDPTRPITSNVFMPGRYWLDGPNEEWKSYDAFISTLGLVGYSYQSIQYIADHKRLPDRMMLSSEINPRDCFKNWMRVVDNEYVVGNFTWTAIDYMGEAGGGWLGFGQPPSIFPWHTSYCGDVDLCGFRKPRSFYRDILFENGKQISMFVHTPKPTFKGKNESLWGWDDVKPSWSWDGYEDSILTIDVYSDFEEVELYLNNKLLGTKKSSRDTEFKTRWEVPYQEGTLMAVGQKSDGTSDTCYLKSTAKPYTVKLSPEKGIMIANRQDLCFIVAEVVDKFGQTVPYANDLITFEVNGEAKLLAVGNGDPTSIESYQQPFRKAFEGKCLLIIKSTDDEGKVEIKAKARGLKSGKLYLKSEGSK